MDSNFTNISKEFISYSREYALKFGNDYISESHFLYSVINKIHYDYLTLLGLRNIHEIVDFIESQNLGIVIKSSPQPNGNINLTKNFEKIIRITVLEIKLYNDDKVDIIHFLLSILKVKESNLTQFLNENGITYDVIRSNYITNKDRILYKVKLQSQKADLNVINNELKKEEDLQTKKIIDHINFIISNNIDAVLNVEEEAKEFALLLTSLNFDQGMMVGLFGRWGRGKTFFWQKVWETLSYDKVNSYNKVEYHAWKYQDTPASWAYLYENIAKSFLSKPSNYHISDWAKYYIRLFKLNWNRKGKLPVLKFLILLLLGAGTMLLLLLIRTNKEQIDTTLKTIGIPITLLLTIYSIIKYLKKEYSSEAKDLFLTYTKEHSFKEHLGVQAEIQKEIEHILKVWIPQPQHTKVAIFVDDIDRCNEEKIIEIIDSLRIMLDNEKINNRVIVITAVDERVLKRAIQNKYSKLIKDSTETIEYKKLLETLVREYMDKLFITGIRLNSLSFDERREILSAMTKNKISGLNNELTPNTEVTVEEKSTQTYSSQSVLKNDSTTETSIPDVEFRTVNFEIDNNEYESLLSILNHYTDATPRTIRIFYYRYLLAKRLIINQSKITPILLETWYSKDIDKTILAYLVMYFTIHGPENIHSGKDKNFKSMDSNKVHCDIFDKQFIIKKTLLEAILKVVEMVVPY